MKTINSFEELKTLKSDGKKYYIMQIKKLWYALALEDFQVTFLQQYIKASRFRIYVDSNQLQKATREITVYDFTSLDDDQLIHVFFERQKAYKEPSYESTPSHLEDRCADDRTIQNNAEYSRMSPYSNSKKKDDNIYYVMKLKNKLYAVALEMHQVKFLKENISINIFNYPINSEQLQETTKEIKTYNFTNLVNDHLLKIFIKK